MRALRKSDRPEPLVVEVAEAISRYLDRHPGAADTAEGIRRWWIAQQRIEESATIVARAIELLENKNVLSRDCVGGTLVYRLKKHTEKG